MSIVHMLEWKEYQNYHIEIIRIENRKHFVYLKYRISNLAVVFTTNI